MLVPEVFEILGGSVEELEAARQRLVHEVCKPPRGKRYLLNSNYVTILLKILNEILFMLYYLISYKNNLLFYNECVGI